MSLRSRPRHKITVQPYREQAGSVGQKEHVPDGLPLTVRCNVHLYSSSELVSFGVREFVDGIIHVYPPQTWPWDEYTRITYDGVEYDQDGAAIHKKMSRSTEHYEISIRKRKKVTP
jgi:hypothetical protein